MADHGNDKQIQEWLTNLLNRNNQANPQPNQRQIQEQRVELENERRPTRSLNL